MKSLLPFAPIDAQFLHVPGERAFRYFQEPGCLLVHPIALVQSIENEIVLHFVQIFRHRRI